MATRTHGPTTDDHTEPAANRLVTLTGAGLLTIALTAQAAAGGPDAGVTTVLTLTVGALLFTLGTLTEGH